MALAELIRQTTLPVRDDLLTIDAELRRALAERDASEEREKRCGTEITRQRALEANSRKLRNDADEKVAEARRSFEELDRRRQQALESLLSSEEEQSAAVQSLRDAHTAVEAAQADIIREQKALRAAEALVSELQAKRGERQGALRQVALQTLHRHMESQAVRFYAAFDSQVQRAGVLRASEELKKARHTDPEVGRLCEQREELQKFLSTATVPEVRAILQASVRGIEVQLDKRFPGGLVPPPHEDGGQIDELLYYSQGGRVVFLLPVDSAAWSAASADDPTENADRAMCLVWSFLREMKLKCEDGEFSIWRGQPVFKSRFEPADVAILQGFSVRDHGSVLARFVLSAVPTEVQEALTDDDENI
jgi:hypothetical protein